MQSGNHDFKSLKCNQDWEALLYAVLSTNARMWWRKKCILASWLYILLVNIEYTDIKVIYGFKF